MTVALTYPQEDNYVFDVFCCCKSTMNSPLFWYLGASVVPIKENNVLIIDY